MNGYMHGDGKGKSDFKGFSKPRRVPLGPKEMGELGSHLRKKWHTESSECVHFSKMDWCKLRSLLQPCMCDHNTPYGTRLC